MTTIAINSASSSRRRGIPARRRVIYASLAVTLSVAAVVSMAELVLRARAGDWSLRNLGPSVGAIPTDGPGPTRYDSVLGYTPAPGRHDWRSWSSTVRPSGLRSNGPEALNAVPRILAVGDSFTFGDEVADFESWPAQLERQSGVAVGNAGVFGYGLDQAVLRAELLLERSTTVPNVVVLALVSDDITRCELSCRHAYKPWFSIDHGALVAHHDPVPRMAPRRPWLHRLVGVSYAVRGVARRLAPDWWYLQSHWREHRDGERVALELLKRLDDACTGRGSSLLIVGLCGRNGDRARLEPVLAACESASLDVLDLSLALARRSSVDFEPGGHLAAAANAWVASRIAEQLSMPSGSLVRSINTESNRP